jgi:hypothetical protein
VAHVPTSRGNAPSGVAQKRSRMLKKEEKGEFPLFWRKVVSLVGL